MNRSNVSGRAMRNRATRKFRRNNSCLRPSNPPVTLTVRNPFVAALALAFASAAHAGPTETVIVAAMKLPEAANYTWRTEVVDDARTYEISGQTERAGDLSRVTMPLVSS